MSDEYEINDIPGVGEVRARKGTSTAELAGAVKFWHDKYQVSFDEGRDSVILTLGELKKHAWRDGFLSACVVLGLAGIAAGAAIHLWF